MHGATCIQAPKGLAVQLILIVDAVGVLERIPADTENCMPITPVLTGKAKDYTVPDVKLVAMPEPSPDHEDSLRKLIQSSVVAGLMKLFGEDRFAMKGFQSATSTMSSNAALDLFLHELNEIACYYPAEVVKSIKEYYAARGVQKAQLSFRYHMNIVGGECITKTSHQSRLKPDHNPHCDAVRTDSNEKEKKTERAAAAITINATQDEIFNFKKMIKDSEKEVPGKTGHPDYDFEKTVGKADYAPSLFISTAKQNMITGRINRQFLDVIRNAEYLINELDGEYVSTAKPTITAETVDALRQDEN